jgi:hypothetical protein
MDGYNLHRLQHRLIHSQRHWKLPWERVHGLLQPSVTKQWSVFGAFRFHHVEASVFYLLANALRATGREEDARAALRRVSELHTTSLEVDRRIHDAVVAEAR